VVYYLPREYDSMNPQRESAAVTSGKSVGGAEKGARSCALSPSVPLELAGCCACGTSCQLCSVSTRVQNRKRKVKKG
jgi:hypothetical protein